MNNPATAKNGFTVGYGRALNHRIGSSEQGLVRLAIFFKLKGGLQ